MPNPALAFTYLLSAVVAQPPLSTLSWPTISKYSIPSPLPATLKFCATQSKTPAVFVTLLSFNATSTTTAESLSLQATVLASTFSDDVHRIRLQNNDSIIPSNRKYKALYQLIFEERECIPTVLKFDPNTTADSLNFGLVASSKDVTFTFYKSNNVIVQPTCLLNCGPSESETGWISPVAASLLTSLTSIVGVIFLYTYKGKMEILIEYMLSFAAGCLLGVVVFHLYAEAISYLSEFDEWVAGTCVLCGVVFAILIEQGTHMILHKLGAGHHHHHTVEACSSAESQQTPDMSSVEGVMETNYISGPISSRKPQTWYTRNVSSFANVQPNAWITAIGDCFHAFTDGIVMGVGFKSCSATIGWTIAFGIILHEVPHRIGDFFIFLKAGMNTIQALFVNFVASLASLIGVLVLLILGEVEKSTLGILLALGAGTLLFIALGQLLPPMLEVRGAKEATIHLFGFCLGAILIGLSLLKETECEV